MTLPRNVTLRIPLTEDDIQHIVQGNIGNIWAFARTYTPLSEWVRPAYITELPRRVVEALQEQLNVTELQNICELNECEPREYMSEEDEYANRSYTEDECIFVAFYSVYGNDDNTSPHMSYEYKTNTLIINATLED